MVRANITTEGIGGATLLVLNGVNAGRMTVADGDGFYRFDGLQVGEAQFSANAPGYRESLVPILINSGVNTRNFALASTGLPTTFGAGTHRIGTDIDSGRYYSDPVSGCYWERLSGFGGTFAEVIGNDLIAFNAAQAVVDILSTDRGFSTNSECATWSRTQRPPPSANTITPGTWVVGPQIATGTYRATVTEGCYWERLRNFTGDFNALIANDFVSGGGNVIVTIPPGDAGFHTNSNCGTWTRSQSTTFGE